MLSHKQLSAFKKKLLRKGAVMQRKSFLQTILFAPFALLASKLANSNTRWIFLPPRPNQRHHLRSAGPVDSPEFWSLGSACYCPGGGIATPGKLRHAADIS